MMMVYDAQNREVPDLTPVELPAGTIKPESLENMIARMVRNAQYLKEFEGHETIDEADDFDVDNDDEVMLSNYELKEMREEYPVERRGHEKPAPAAQQPRPVENENEVDVEVVETPTERSPAPTTPSSGPKKYVLKKGLDSGEKRTVKS